MIANIDYRLLGSILVVQPQTRGSMIYIRSDRSDVQRGDAARMAQTDPDTEPMNGTDERPNIGTAVS